MALTTTRALTDGQRLQFERDGFFIARGLFSEDEVAAIRETFMTQAKDGPVAGMSEIKHGGQGGYDSSDPLAFYPRMMMPHLHSELPVGPVAHDFMLHPRLEPFLREMLDDDPLAVQSMFYFKPPGARGQDLHQDNFYLRVKPGTCLAAWLAVDDADEENGGMVVVPETSDLAVACPEKSDPTLFFTSDHVAVPEGRQELPLQLKAGDVLFFNGSVIHGSYPNTSKDRFRRALICHYVPANSQELAHWYVNPTTFDGQVVEIPEAVGGGPCGVAQGAMGRH